MQMSELSKHKDLLLDKLAEFDSTNQSLRKMLRSQQNFEVCDVPYVRTLLEVVHAFQSAWEVSDFDTVVIQAYRTYVCM